MVPNERSRLGGVVGAVACSRTVGAMETAAGPTVVTAERMVPGGLALSRDDDGRVVLVAGAIPGERVAVTTEVRRGAVHGEVVEVLDPSPDRVEPPCPFVALGCGGCDW